MNDTLSTIASTIASEFSDVTDVAQATRIVVRLFLAAFLGGLLGWQREANGGEEATAVISTIFALLILSVVPLLTKSTNKGKSAKSD